MARSQASSYWPVGAMLAVEQLLPGLVSDLPLCSGESPRGLPVTHATAMGGKSGVSQKVCLRALRSDRGRAVQAIHQHSTDGHSTNMIASDGALCQPTLPQCTWVCEGVPM